MNKKRLKNIFITFWATFIFSLGSYTMYSEASVDESSITHYTGIVSEIGITKDYISTKHGVRNSNVFFVKLIDLDETLAIYNSDQEYSFLSYQLNIGDTISVAYKLSVDKDRPNINTYEIIKDETTILSQSAFRIKRYILSVVTGLAALGFLTHGIRTDKKLKTKNQGILKKPCF